MAKIKTFEDEDETGSGDVSGFPKPKKISISQYVKIEPHFADEALRSLEREAVDVGQKIGTEILDTVLRLSRQLSLKYGRAMSLKVKKTILNNIPSDVVDLSEYEEFGEEAFDVTYMDGISDYAYNVMKGLIPQLNNLVAKCAEGLDWGMPMPFSDEILDKIPPVENL